MLSRKHKPGRVVARVVAGVTKTRSMCHIGTHKKRVVRRAQLADLV